MQDLYHQQYSGPNDENGVFGVIIIAIVVVAAVSTILVVSVSTRTLEQLALILVNYRGCLLTSKSSTAFRSDGTRTSTLSGKCWACSLFWQGLLEPQTLSLPKP